MTHAPMFDDSQYQYDKAALPGGPPEGLMSREAHIAWLLNELRKRGYEPGKAENVPTVTTPVIEIDTLIQKLHPSEIKKAADEELAMRLNEGWEIVNLSILNPDKPLRVVTLQREKSEDQPEPAREGAYATATSTSWPVGDAMIIIPPVPSKPERVPVVLNELPLGEKIRREGLDAVIDEMNEEAMRVGKEAFEAARRRRNHHPTLLDSSQCQG